METKTITIETGYRTIILMPEEAQAFKKLLSIYTDKELENGNITINVDS